MKRFYIFPILLIAAFALHAQAPANYYNSAAGKNGDELKLALHNIIKGHTKKSYSYIWTAYGTTDINPTNNRIWDIYSNSQYLLSDNQCGEYTGEGDCYNREHLWARSWANKSNDDNDTMVSDLHHIFPTDGWVNALRSNYPFGEVSNATTTTGNGSKLGPNTVSGYNGTVFEPIDEYKGDIARALMYMSVRYYGGDATWATTYMTDKSVIKDWAMTMLLKWHHDDPVSTKEVNRNNAVYGIQGNRNPFIDNPEYADMIWDPNWSSTYQIAVATNSDAGGSAYIWNSQSLEPKNSSINYPDKGFANGASLDNQVVAVDGNVNVGFYKNAGSNAPAYYNTGTAIRFYLKNSFVVSTSAGNITSITLTYGGDDGTATISTDVGTFNTNVWTGSAESVTFTLGDSGSNRRIRSMSVTYGPVQQGSFANNTTTTIIAIPNVGYHFVNWTKGTTVVSADATFNLTVNENATYQANFEINTYDIAVAANPTAGGIAYIGDAPSPSSPKTVLITFSDCGFNNATSVDGIAIWLDNKVKVTFNKGTGNSPTYYDNGESIRVYSYNNFEVSVPSGVSITTIILTYGTGDGNNTISTEVGTFNTNTWTGSEQSVTFNIQYLKSNHRRIHAMSVTYTDDSPSYITQATFNYGETATITATPNDGYSFVNWTKDNVNVSANPSYSFTVTEAGNYVANFINNNVTASTTIPSLTINGNVTVNSNVALTVTGNITQPDGSSIEIRNNGQLICNNSVYVKMQKSITAWNATTNKGWYAIASPVNNQAFADVVNLVNTTNNPLHNIYRYNEASFEWEEYRSTTTAPFNSFENGRGYIFRTNDSHGIIEFKGNNNVDDVGYDLSYACAIDDIKGFNLIGNPFTQNIKWTDVEKTNVDPDGYYLLEEAGANQGKWQAVTNANAAITPMRAFLVQATDNNPSVTISRTISKGETGNDDDNIMFAVSNSQYSDEAYVFFKEGHGLNKIEHRNTEIPMLYVVNNDEHFAIADMNDNTKIINLGFEAKMMGQYKLNVKADGDFSYLHLIDRLTGEDFDMLIENEYSFIGSPQDNKSRFIVRLELSGNAGDSENSTFACQNGDEIIVTGEGELQMFDVMGRHIASYNVNGVETMSTSSLQTGVYILRLIGDDIKTQKIVVK